MQAAGWALRPVLLAPLRGLRGTRPRSPSEFAAIEVAWPSTLVVQRGVGFRLVGETGLPARLFLPALLKPLLLLLEGRAFVGTARPLRVRLLTPGLRLAQA